MIIKLFKLNSNSIRKSNKTHKAVTKHIHVTQCLNHHHHSIKIMLYALMECRMFCCGADVALLVVVCCCCCLTVKVSSSLMIEIVTDVLN